MTYFPADPDVFRPGLPGNATPSSQLLENVDTAYVEYGPPIFGPVVCSLGTTFDSDQVVCEIDLPANEDNVPVYCRIRWRGTTGHTATVTFEVDDGGTVDTDTDTNTSSSYTTTSLLVTPTSNNYPRVARLWLRTSTLGQIAQIISVVVGYAPPSYPTDVTAVGVGIFGGAWASGNYPIPREVIGRAHNNLRGIARDRPAGLAGGITRVVWGAATPSAGPVYEVSGDTWTQVERWLQPGSDEGRRYYRLCMLLSGDDPEARMTIGSYVWAISGTGWHETVVQISLNEGMRCAIYMRSSSAGDVVMNTWQVQRAAPPVTYDDVAVCYRSPGGAGDYADADGVGELLCDGSGLRIFAISMWAKAAVGADATSIVPFEVSDDGAPGLRCAYTSGELEVTLTDDSAAASGGEIVIQSTNAAYHHLFITSRAEAPAFDSEGTQLWYDGVSVIDGSPLVGVFATAIAKLRLFARHNGSLPFPGDIANVAVFDALPPSVEITALASAGVTHNARNPAGRWRRRRPAVYFCDGDPAGSGPIASVGRLAAALSFSGDITIEAL